MDSDTGRRGKDAAMNLFEIWHYINSCKITTHVVSDTMENAVKIWRGHPDHTDRDPDQVYMDKRLLLLDGRLITS
jgi:hypothetical protein